MRKIKKIMAVTLVMSMLATMLIGCGGKEVTNEADTTNEVAGDVATAELTDANVESGEESTDSAFETSRTDFNFIQTPFYDREVVYRDHFIHEIEGENALQYSQSYISPEDSQYQCLFASRNGYLFFDIEGSSALFDDPSESENGVTCFSGNGEMLYWNVERLGQDEKSYFKNRDMEALAAQSNWEEYESTSDEKKFIVSIKNFAEMDDGTIYNGYMLLVDNYQMNNRSTIFYGFNANKNISSEEIKEKCKTIQILDTVTYGPSWEGGYVGLTFENGILERYSGRDSSRENPYYYYTIANYQDVKGNPVEFCYESSEEDATLNFIDNTFDIAWHHLSDYHFRATYLDKIGSADDWKKYNQMRTLEDWTSLLDSDEHFDEDFASRKVSGLVNAEQLVDYCNKFDTDSTEMGNIEVMFPIVRDDGSRGYAYFIVDAEVSGAAYKFTCAAGPNESGNFTLVDEETLATLNTVHPHDTTIVHVNEE